MKITILCVGKIKEKYFRDAIAEYEKRLGRYCKLEIVEVADEKTPDGASGAEEQQIRRKEGERLLKYLEGKNCYVIALAINGKMLDSVALSEKVSDLMVKGNSHIVLVIGGSLGIADEVLKRADEKNKLFEDDISAPADACYFIGAVIPELSDYQS